MALCSSGGHSIKAIILPCHGKDTGSIPVARFRGRERICPLF